MANRKVFKEKMKKKCPDCGGILVISEEEDFGRYTIITIQCSSCDYVEEKREKNRQKKIISPEW